MEPVYEYTDGQLHIKVFIVLCGVGLMVMGFLPLPSDAPLWIAILTRCLILIGPLLLVVVPQVRLRAFLDHIEVTYGMTPAIRFRLANEKIVSIRAVEYNPMRDFGGWGIKGGGGEWRGWMAFTAAVNNKGLAIETTEKNYLLGCPNPDEAETVLKNLVGRG